MLRAVLGNGALFRLELVWAAVTLVRWALAILVALYAYRAGGAGAVGVIAVARIAPAALLAPRLALSADRRSRRQVLLLSVAVRLVVTSAMAVAAFREGAVWVIAVLAATWSVADAVHKPAQVALMTTVARTPGQLGAANALWTMVDNAGFLAASLTVGVALAFAGIAEAFAVVVIPLVLALVALLGVPVDPPTPTLADADPRRELTVGLRTIRALPQLRLLIGLQVANLFVQAMVDILVVIIAVGLLDMGEQGAGWLNSAWGVGGVCGGVVATALLSRHRLPLALRWGLWLVGVPLVAIALWPHVPAAMGALLVVGLGFGMLEVSLLTLGQRLVPCDVMARVYGVEETVTILAMAVGSIAASTSVQLLGERGALVVTGTVLPLVALVVWRRLRQFDGHVDSDDTAYGLVRGVAAFASLPVASLETLASRSRRQLFDAGVDIVRQGEPGDAFFVIEEGHVDVFEHEVHRRVEGPGEHFGEIALLRSVPRTATVRAKSPVALLVLDRPEFLAAVGSFRRARFTLDEVATSRLGKDG
jgi:predicted MFS family arabinose efflux permease